MAAKESHSSSVFQFSIISLSRRLEFYFRHIANALPLAAMYRPFPRMKKKFKIYLDYTPFLILLISACYLLWQFAISEILLVWKHYVGLVFLIITAILFFVRHLFGVLFLGLTLLLGLIGILSYSPAITTTTFGWGDGGDGSVTLLRFQPIFLLWIVLYFILSGRYFVGIASNKYWTEVKNKQR